MAKVTVTIDTKTNEVKYAVEGVVGDSCADLTKALMQNNEVVDQQYTEEYCVPDELPDYIEDVAETLEEELADE